jgi:hypothetical protein
MLTEICIFIVHKRKLDIVTIDYKVNEELA